MNAIHVNWTAPFYEKNECEYYIEDFEILTTILSALMWRKYNGKIKLVADKNAIKFYENAGLIELWNEVSELEIDSINPNMFWAGAKLFALKEQKAPIALIDTDFIVWEKLNFDKISDCGVIHFEELNNNIYPPKSYFEMNDGYVWKDYDWKQKAANTAFCVFKNQKLINEYTHQTIEFMKSAKTCDDYLRYMVFCEQRMLPMCAKKSGYKINEISKQSDLFSSDNKAFTHIWGMKQQMRDNNELREHYCQKCINRIINEFPQMENVLNRIKNGC
ncbi:MAG: hypothetical protein IKV64_03575 [Clostridia bacterium]|nr:hypothetical protein [Clostridia bacterium]